MPDFITSAIAIGGGFFPPLAWAWFWLREDATHPEPRRLIVYAFLAGMATVGIVIPIELSVKEVLQNDTFIFALWSIIEEGVKFLAALSIVLWRRENDEPIDSVIYMILIGLGFAAAENTLFLFSPTSGSTHLEVILSGNFRFVGATLVHVLSSAIIGVMLALAFGRRLSTRTLFAFLGLVLASIAHMSFNYYMLHTPDSYLMFVFEGVWIGIIALFAVLEYVKRIRPRGFA